jgi:hypothetical protein
MTGLDKADFSLKQLRRKYLWQYVLFGIGAIVAVVLASICWSVLISAIASVGLPDDESGRYVLPATGYPYPVFGIFLGIVSATPFIWFYARLQGPQRLRELHVYEHWGNSDLEAARRREAGQIALIRYMARLAAIATIVFVPLSANSYAVFDKEGATVNSFWSVKEERRSYAEIKSLVQSRSYRDLFGKLHSYDGLVFYVVFSDGYRWTNWVKFPPFTKGAKEKRKALDKELLTFLEAKIGRPVQKIETLDDAVPHLR